MAKKNYIKNLQKVASSGKLWVRKFILRKKKPFPSSKGSPLGAKFYGFGKGEIKVFSMPRHVWGVSRASKAQARSARGAFDPRESKSFLDFSPHPAWLPERTACTVTQADLAHDYCCYRASRFAGSFSGRQPRHGIAINYSSIQFINTYVSLCLVWMSAGATKGGRQVPSHSLDL